MRLSHRAAGDLISAVRTDILYRVFPKVLPAELCATIRTLGDALTKVPATVDDPDKRARLDEEVRRTIVGFWDEAHWINGLLLHYATLANREVWNFDLTLVSGVQYATYTERSFFSWHTDEYPSPYGPLAPTHWVHLNRKLSVTVHLSEPADYGGGDLQLKDRLGNVLSIEGAREQGTVLVFPSNIGHTVTPVTSGVRHSLAGWVLGPSFR